jgi:hypothetical protein
MLVVAGILCWAAPIRAQVDRDNPTPPTPPLSSERGVFAAYEITEMATNRFRNFAGETGYRFNAKYRIRASILEVDLTERDLAGWWSASVDGKGVEGYFRAYEFHADRFLSRGWYLSANVGYIANTFQHVTLPDRLENKTMTAGVGIGYSRAGLFGVEHLFLDVTNPVRYYFNGIAETRLGSATVRAHTVVPNTWIFVGYKR